MEKLAVWLEIFNVDNRLEYALLSIRRCVCVCVYCTAPRGTENDRAKAKVSCPSVRHDGKLGSRGTAPFIINLDTRCNRVVRFTRRMLSSPGYRQKYLWIGCGGGPQNQCGRFVKRKECCPSRESNKKTEIKVTFKNVLRSNYLFKDTN